MRRTIFEDVHDDFRESARAFLDARGGAAARAVGGGRHRRSRVLATGGGARLRRLRRAGGVRRRRRPTTSASTPSLDEEIAGTGAVGDGFTMSTTSSLRTCSTSRRASSSERWLPGVMSGETVVAIAMTEPGAGSDLRGCEHRAPATATTTSLNGSKTFVTSGIQADLVIVAAPGPRPTAAARA